MSTGPDDKSVPQDREPFLDRWSRRKVEARQEKPPAAREQDAAAKSPAPELPPVEKLTFDSDYRAFFHPKVSEDTRRAALKKLFSDPRFNVMDGLDVYIDDYSKSDPIPPAMLASLRQAQKILGWAKGEDNPEQEGPQERVKTAAAGTQQAAALEDQTSPVAPATGPDGQAVETDPAAPGQGRGNRSPGSS